MSSDKSRNYRGRGKHAANKYGVSGAEEAESNLQPLNFDACGFDELGEEFEDEPEFDAPAQAPVEAAEEAAPEAAEPEPVAPEAAVAPAAAAADVAPEPVDTPEPEPASDIQDAKRFNMDEIMAASTSQLVAIAVGEDEAQAAEAAEPADAPTADPAAPEPKPAEVDASDLGLSGSAKLSPVAAAVFASQDELPEPSAADPYSRDAATYTHRKGWRSWSLGKKIGLIVAIVVVIALGIAAGVSFALWQNAAEDIAIDDETVTEALTPVEDPAIDPYWVLVLGSDSRNKGKDDSRSDVMLLVRVDPNTPRVTMVSIPRDTKVEVKGYGTQKINAAYAFGGASLAIKTVEKYAGVKISHYAEVYFNGLEDLVDGMGGITVNVPEYCSYSDVTLQPGTQTLTGHEALIFARCRKTYSQGDFTRTKCQRILFKALVKKVLNQDAVTMTSTITKATKCFKTDIKLQDLIDLATKMKGMTGDDFYSGMAPSTTGMVDGVSYTFTYINQWKLIMQKAENGEKPVLNKKEQEICGYDSTDYNELDMSEGLPKSVQKKLDAYYAEKEAKAAAKASASTSGTVTSISGTTETAKSAA